MERINKKGYKFFCLILIIFVVISTILFVSFCIKEKNHECDGSKCSICYNIILAEKVVKQKVTLAISSVLFVILGLLLIKQNYESISIFRRDTLVKLHVEMDD